MTPGWVPAIEELNDRIAEAALRAERARLQRRWQLRSWMPALAEPFTPEPKIPYSTQMEVPEIPAAEMPGVDESWQPTKPSFEMPARRFTPTVETGESQWQPQPVARRQPAPQQVETQPQ